MTTKQKVSYKYDWDKNTITPDTPDITPDTPDITPDVVTTKHMIPYKYNEDKALEELKKYIDNTYDEHYSRNKFQATEFIIDGGHGEGFCIGNILKYAQRYGKKNGKDRKDLLKVIHYGIIALYINENEDLNNEIK